MTYATAPTFGFCALTVAFALGGCSSAGDSTGATGGDGALGDGGSDRPGDGVDAVPEAGSVDASQIETGTFELPRTQADPNLTRRIAGGAAALVGGDDFSCSRGTTSDGSRWCAFSRPAAGKTELWVVNVTELTKGAAGLCDGSSVNCRRVTADVWAGMPLWGPSHPSAHHFQGDTLIFHAGPAPGMREPYEGAIWAWRPSWATPRPLTSDRGVLCGGQSDSGVVYCLDNAVIDSDPTSAFKRPRLREFDLLAGVVTDETMGPLAKVARLTNAGSDQAWRLRVSPGGQYLAFSSVPAAGATETVQVIKVADIGRADPVIVATDAADWEIAQDGAKLYYLRDFDRARGEAASGNLMLADFPNPATPTELAGSVLAFELVGAFDRMPAPVDRGVLIARESPMGPPTFSLLKDRSKPSDLLDLGNDTQGLQVASDARHTLYLKQFPGANFPVAYVARNDGSGSCQLTSDSSAETYGTRFDDSARSVFWIEYGRHRSESEEGWYARPETCAEKTKFGDFVFRYRVVGDEFVVFEGGDLGDTTSWLQYSPLRQGSSGQLSPRVIKEHPGESLEVLKLGSQVWVLFSISQGDATEVGLYLHGPLQSAQP